MFQSCATTIRRTANFCFKSILSQSTQQRHVIRSLRSTAGYIRSTVLRPSIVNPCFITLAVASHSSKRLMFTLITSPAQTRHDLLFYKQDVFSSLFPRTIRACWQTILALRLLGDRGTCVNNLHKIVT